MIPVTWFLLTTLKRKRFTLRSSTEFLIWILPTLPIIWITRETQNAVVHLQHGWLSKILTALDSYGFYIQKFIWPFHLNVDYGRTPDWLIANLTSNFLPISLTIIVVISLIFLKPAPLKFALLAYLLLLLPVSGLITFGFQIYSSVADHYMYMAIVPLSFLILKLMELTATQAGPKQGFTYLTLLLIFFLAFLTYERNRVWVNNKSLFQSVIAENPNSYIGHLNLGKLYLEEGRIPQAAEHIFKANQIAPDIFTGFVYKMNILNQMGQRDEVLKHNSEIDSPYFEEIGKTFPTNLADLYITMASSLFAKGRFEDAYLRTCKATKIDPFNKVARSNLDFFERNRHRINIKSLCN